MDKSIIISSIGMAIDIYTYVIIARIFMSWFPGSQGSEAGRFLISITDPVMKPARKIIPHMGMLDLSPIVVIIILNILRNIVAGL